MADNKTTTVCMKSPVECTGDEIDTFERLILEGGEVTDHGLRKRIIRAEKLIFILESECIAVGAIKNPYPQYKENVFVKAGVSESQEKYKYELGWLYVNPSSRGKGVGHKLMQSVTGFVGDSGCFATTRENNNTMRQLFDQYSFKQIGSGYKSSDGDYLLVLYANMA